MPFISRAGNLIIDDDVSKHVLKNDPETGKMKAIWTQKSFDRELILTNVGNFAFDETHESFVKYVFAGKPNKDGLYFEDNPWFRITTQEMDDRNLWRFYKRFRDDVTGKLAERVADHSQTVYYIPSVDDFQVSKYGAKRNFHFPLWLLDIIIADKLIDRGKLMSKDNQSARYISDREVEELFEIYEARKRDEDSGSELVEYIQGQYAQLRDDERKVQATRGLVGHHQEKAFAKELVEEQHKAETIILEKKLEDETDESLSKQLAESFKSKKAPKATV